MMVAAALPCSSLPSIGAYRGSQGPQGEVRQPGAETSFEKKKKSVYAKAAVFHIWEGKWSQRERGFGKKKVEWGWTPDGRRV